MTVLTLGPQLQSDVALSLTDSVTFYPLTTGENFEGDSSDFASWGWEVRFGGGEGVVGGVSVSYPSDMGATPANFYSPTPNGVGLNLGAGVGLLPVSGTVTATYTMLLTSTSISSGSRSTDSEPRRGLVAGRSGEAEGPSVAGSTWPVAWVSGSRSDMAADKSARARCLVAILGLGVSACAGVQSSPAPITPKPTPSAGARVAPAAAAAPAAYAWLSELDRDNALVGKLWDVKAGAFVDESAALKNFAAARFILLGERHDNPDHHRLQARVLEQLAKAGRKPAVVLEMLEVPQQAALTEYTARTDAQAAGVGAALAWEKTSWPPFSQYQPIFEAAFSAKLSLHAGNLAQADAKALVKQGLAALPAERVKELRLDQAFPAPLEASLLEELRASHCGQLPEKYLAPMALAQHARDAQMAKVLASAGAKDGAVLIAGGGHARLDRGVPYYLALEAAGASVASLVFREVRHGDADPQAYVSEEGPFDYVWFTPRASDEDPCAGFKAPAK